VRVFAIAQSTTEKTGYKYGDPHEPGTARWACA
jgi:hypothetical protein